VFVAVQKDAALRNMKFVQKIEKYPCIYNNFIMPEY
jgi:hypothetical protein